MTKKNSIKKRKTYKKIRLSSELKTGYFYITKKSTRMQTKLAKAKYDPIARAHCVFNETKLN
ncbi:ribosomal protein L33 [Candidatus Hodgkinia cicadicola]|nr:ribosomal protein L33 [Candidatus Hodgkinia cicadicola]